jgi:hypothetical protein
MSTGKNTRDAIQAFIDVSKNSLTDHANISISRDFDSLIGISNELLLTSAISVYPVPNPAGALTTSIHLKRSVEQDDGEVIDVRTRH